MFLLIFIFNFSKLVVFNFYFSLDWMQDMVACVILMAPSTIKMFSSSLQPMSMICTRKLWKGMSQPIFHLHRSTIQISSRGSGECESVVRRMPARIFYLFHVFLCLSSLILGPYPRRSCPKMAVTPNAPTAHQPWNQ